MFLRVGPMTANSYQDHTVDRATTFNLDDLFEEGVALNAEARLPTDFFGLPGHQLFGGIWSSRDVALLSRPHHRR